MSTKKSGSSSVRAKQAKRKVRGKALLIDDELVDDHSTDPGSPVTFEDAGGLSPSMDEEEEEAEDLSLNSDSTATGSSEVQKLASEVAEMKRLMREIIEAQGRTEKRYSGLLHGVAQSLPMERTVLANPAPPTPAKAVMKKPTVFSGKKDRSQLDPIAWLKLMKTFLRANNVTEDVSKISTTTSYFTGDAAVWWSAIKERTEDWTEFKRIFFSRYVTAADSDIARRELENLRQGSSTVPEYSTRFSTICAK